MAVEAIQLYALLITIIVLILLLKLREQAKEHKREVLEAGEKARKDSKTRQRSIIKGDQLATLAARRDGRGNDTWDRPQAAIESQLCEKFMLCKRVLWHLPRGTENTQCDRQVKTPAFLG